MRWVHRVVDRKRALRIFLILAACVLTIGGVLMALSDPMRTWLSGVLHAYLDIRPEACVAYGVRQPDSFRIDAIANPLNGLAVLYSATCVLPGQPTVNVEGYRLYMPMGPGWSEVAGSENPVEWPPPGQLASFSGGTGLLPESKQLYTLVTGHIFTDTVSQIVITLANGDRHTFTPIHAHYLIIVPSALSVCTLQLVNSHSGALAQYHLGWEGLVSNPPCPP